jgi:hypothetical protein
MSWVQTKISVTGFNKAEIINSLQDFFKEFDERPWLLKPQAKWDAEKKVLLVIVETEENDPKLESEGIFDEIWDCVIAYFNFSSEKISFKILEAVLIDETG